VALPRRRSAAVLAANLKSENFLSAKKAVLLPKEMIASSANATGCYRRHAEAYHNKLSNRLLDALNTLKRSDDDKAKLAAAKLVERLQKAEFLPTVKQVAG